MWQDKVVIWEETDYIWDNFGETTSAPNIDEDDLYAKGIIIWKQTTLKDFIENSLSIIESIQDYSEDKNILTSVMLVFAVANLFPFHIKIIQDDDIANNFLSLLHKEKGEQYILKKEFQDSDFGSMESLKLLIDSLIDNDILTETSDKYVINGTVLNGVHISD